MTRIAIALLLAAAPAHAQVPSDAHRPFEISDNSFLVEEAFNQEAGVFQNVLLIQRPNGNEWSFEFTQEWPLGGQRHQLSYTVPLEGTRPGETADYQFGRGTIALHYRYQLSTEDGGGVATSPRLSLLIPRSTDGERQLGMQFNFPASRQFANLYLHGNAGFTISEGTRGHAAASAIYRTWPMVHLMLETVYNEGWVVSPGVRAGANVGNTQLVLGLAVPIGISGHETQHFLAYLSYELPFKR